MYSIYLWSPIRTLIHLWAPLTIFSDKTGSHNPSFCCLWVSFHINPIWIDLCGCFSAELIRWPAHLLIYWNYSAIWILYWSGQIWGPWISGLDTFVIQDEGKGKLLGQNLKVYCLISPSFPISLFLLLNNWANNNITIWDIKTWINYFTCGIMACYWKKKSL